jgi:hypothetical protein
MMMMRRRSCSSGVLLTPNKEDEDGGGGGGSISQRLCFDRPPLSGAMTQIMTPTPTKNLLYSLYAYTLYMCDCGDVIIAAF